MSLSIGRRGKLWGKIEVGGYGTTQTFAASNALRHIEFQDSFDPTDRAPSPEKKATPGDAHLFDRRVKADLSNLTGLLRPSGTLNTLSEVDFILEAAFGAKTNVALSTTVASGGAVSGATLTSTTGLAVGGALLILVSGKLYVRVIQTLPGANAVTWAPNLPGAPANGATVKSATVYSFTTNLATSVALVHKVESYVRELRGVGIDKLQINIDANEEPRFTASGPGQTRLSDAAAVDVSALGFTSVGGNPPSGMVGDLWIGNTAYLHKKFGYELSNGLKVRNEEAGNDGIATEVFRDGKRSVALSLEAFVESAATLHDLAKAGTYASLLRQVGRTEGNIVALYCPRVEWKVPDTDSGDSAVNWSYKGRAVESTLDAGDESKLILA